MRAALYYRVSSPGQVDCYGWDAQKRLLPEHCQRVGWEVVEEYEEAGVSGDSLTQRPAMLRMLDDAAAGGFDVILSIEDTRLSRGQLRDWEYIKSVCDDCDVMLATPTGTIYRPGNEDDDFLVDIRGAVSKREKRQINARLARGKREAALQGRIVARLPPYGYRFEHYGARASDKRLVVMDQEAEVVRRIFDLSAHGHDGEAIGFQRIAERLALEGVLTPDQKPWKAAKVHWVLRNSVYCGELVLGRRDDSQDARKRREQARQQGKPVPPRARPPDRWLTISDPSIVPAIIDRATWDASCAALAFRRTKGAGRPATTGQPSLLKGLLVCGVCGRAMCCQQRRRQHGRHYRFYSCVGYTAWRRLHCERCCNSLWAAEVIEQTVWALVSKTLASPRRIKRLIGQHVTRLPKLRDVSALQRQLLDLDQQDRRVRVAYSAGVYGVDALASETARIQGLRESLERQIEAAAQHNRDHGLAGQRAADVQDLCRHYSDLVKTATADQRRALICIMTERVVLSTDGSVGVVLSFGLEPISSKSPYPSKRAHGFTILGTVPDG